MTRDDIYALAWACYVVFMVALACCGLVGCSVSITAHDAPQPVAAPSVAYCVEPHPPGTLATFAPCRNLIADSVWPL